MDSTNKKRYLYILTPKGMEERLKVSIRFLEKKMEEYDLESFEFFKAFKKRL